LILRRDGDRDIQENSSAESEFGVICTFASRRRLGGNPPHEGDHFRFVTGFKDCILSQIYLGIISQTYFPLKTFFKALIDISLNLGTRRSVVGSGIYSGKNLFISTTPPQLKYTYPSASQRSDLSMDCSDNADSYLPQTVSSSLDPRTQPP